MLYSPLTGKRIKEPFNHITWAHKALNLKDYQLKQCLFGEHLLKNHNGPVAIVESEKTAIIASVYFPKLTWVACGSLSNLNQSLLKVLSERSVSLFPDLGGYAKWSEKAAQLSNIVNAKVSDLLEKRATEEERKDGLDLADYLLKFDPQDFLHQGDDSNSEPKETKPHNELHDSTTPVAMPITVHKLDRIVTQQANGGSDGEAISTNHRELVEFFTDAKLPEGPIALGGHGTIVDVQKFVQSHIAVVNLYGNNRTFSSFASRLELLKQILLKDDKLKTVSS
jgi:hypothetical protein